MSTHVFRTLSAFTLLTSGDAEVGRSPDLGDCVGTGSYQSRDLLASQHQPLRHLRCSSRSLVAPPNSVPHKPDQSLFCSSRSPGCRSEDEAILVTEIRVSAFFFIFFAAHARQKRVASLFPAALFELIHYPTHHSGRRLRGTVAQ